MAEINITALKEAICAQQQLLQKVYAELDEERESSATAVSEALSMIQRLQEEKSALMMEASQYKRMTEEEICHAEETLAIYEDMMYQEELEMSVLEFQVQAYKAKLESLGGCDDDLGEESEAKYQESLLSLLRNDASSMKMGSNGSVGKLKSLPAITRQKSLNTSNKVLRIMKEKADKEVNNDQSLALSKISAEKSAVGGDFESYWEQIRRLDERVKEIADYKEADHDQSLVLRKNSVLKSDVPLLAQLSSDTSSCDPRSYEIGATLDQSKASPERNEVANSGRTSCVYDIYEVRDIIEDCKNCTIEEGEKRPEETFESKPMLVGEQQQEKRSSNTRDAASALAAECHESDFQQLSQRVDCLEVERDDTSQENARDVGGEQLRLLREIREQLDSIKHEMTSSKADEKEKSSQHEQEDSSSCFASLKDVALLHFLL